MRYFITDSWERLTLQMHQRIFWVGNILMVSWPFPESVQIERITPFSLPRAEVPPCQLVHMPLLSGDNVAGITWLVTPPDTLCPGARGFTGDRDVLKPSKISQNNQVSQQLPSEHRTEGLWRVAQAPLLFFSPPGPAAWLLLSHLPSRSLWDSEKQDPPSTPQQPGEMKAGGALHLWAAVRVTSLHCYVPIHSGMSLSHKSA